MVTSIVSHRIKSIPCVCFHRCLSFCSGGDPPLIWPDPPNHEPPDPPPPLQTLRHLPPVRASLEDHDGGFHDKETWHISVRSSDLKMMQHFKSCLKTRAKNVQMIHVKQLKTIYMWSMTIVTNRGGGGCHSCSEFPKLAESFKSNEISQLGKKVQLSQARTSWRENKLKDDILIIYHIVQIWRILSDVLKAFNSSFQEMKCTRNL